MPIAKILAFCCTKRSGTIFAILIIAIFFILSFLRTYPFESLQRVLTQTGDDWSLYARYALDIKHNSLLMPSVDGSYYFPAGYLYNYFLAFCFLVFGESIYPIYIMQHLMLGFSVAFVYWAFRDKMRNFTSLAFLCTLFFFAYKDVYKNYSSLLLSENLALFTVSLFFFCFIKGFEKDNFVLQLAAAVSMGLSIMSRPNIAVYGAMLIPIAALYYIKKGKPGFTKLPVFAAVLILSSSLLLIRNYSVCKKLNFLPTQASSIKFIKMYNPIPPSVDLSKVNANPLYTILHFNKDIVGYAEYAAQQPFLFFEYYRKKILFCLGDLSTLSSGYGLRRHWVIMWIGYAIYLFLRIKDRRKFEMSELAVHLYIVCYYGSLIVSGPINNYGFRMLIPAIFFVLPFAFMALDRLWSGITAYSAGPGG